ncbi:TolC family protein [Pelagicoccus mobilis]|uniref:TolC family protein n=1 Tax=Pelagicoccus mobilis TaxID=415221 RepID=A0A934S3C8_9BACT|nr:TolC family protein [Pelagicoccus mobilis]MBK1879057.1 TolC family protein [Pelagicoccus mobilis]
MVGVASHAEVSLAGKMPEEVLPQMGEVIALALENSDTVKVRAFVEGEAKGKRISANSAVMPKFTSSFSFRQEKDEDTDGKAEFEDRVVYSIVFKHPLYHWGSLQSQKKIGQLQFDMEGLSSARIISDLIQKVRRDYMALVILKQKLTRSRVDLDEAVARLEYHQESVEQGKASKTSLFNYELAVERQELAVLRNESDWDYRLGSFARLTGVDAEVLGEKIADEIPEFEMLTAESIYGFDTFFQQGVELDEDYQRMNLDVEVQKQNLKIINQSLKPKLDAQLGLSSNALDLDGTRREQSYSYFGVAVGWSIFDGFRKKGRSMEAMQRLSRMEFGLEGVETDLVRGFEQMRTRLEIERRSLAIEERALIATEGRLEWIQSRVEEGLDSEAALEKIQKDYDNASLRAQNLRISYLTALSALVSELGLDALSVD